MPDSPSTTPDEVADEPVRVAGTVRLMTDEPIPAEELEEGSGIWAAACRVLLDKPWLVPAGLLGLTALVLVSRRRRD